MSLPQFFAVVFEELRETIKDLTQADLTEASRHTLDAHAHHLHDLLKRIVGSFGDSTDELSTP